MLGCLGPIVIGMQPPNELAAWVVGAMVVVLLALWFGYVRRHFPGPPQEVLDQLRPAETSMVENSRERGPP